MVQSTSTPPPSPLPIHHVLLSCSSLKHTLCKSHNFQTAQKALFTQPSKRGSVLCCALLFFSKCTLRIWREGIPTVSLLEPQRSATSGFYFIHGPQMWLSEQEERALSFLCFVSNYSPTWKSFLFFFCPCHSPLSFSWANWIVQHMKRRTIFKTFVMPC